MDSGLQGTDAAFNNIGATPEACRERQARFNSFLNDYTIIENTDTPENGSQLSNVSGMCDLRLKNLKFRCSSTCKYSLDWTYSAYIMVICVYMSRN